MARGGAWSNVVNELVSFAGPPAVEPVAAVAGRPAGPGMTHHDAIERTKRYGIQEYWIGHLNVTCTGMLPGCAFGVRRFRHGVPE